MHYLPFLWSASDKAGMGTHLRSGLSRSNYNTSPMTKDISCLSPDRGPSVLIQNLILWSWKRVAPFSCVEVAFYRRPYS